MGILKNVLAALVLAVLAPGAQAAEPPRPTGLWFTTDYPAMAIRAGDTTNIKLELQNSGLPPQRVALSVSGVPKGWKATLLGGGVPVTAAMPTTNETLSLQLRLEVPGNAEKGTHRIVVAARSPSTSVDLPLDLVVGQSLPPRLAIKAKLPSQRGSASTSFEFPIVVYNESDRDAIVKLAAQAPEGFQTSFSEQYGTQEIGSIPIEAGQNKELKVKVQPLSTAAAGEYPVTVNAAMEGAQATTRLAVQVTGAPKLRITTEDGRLSGEAEAGSTTPVSLIIENTGSAPANSVTLSATPPSDWKIDFEPDVIPELGPGQKITVQAAVTPSSKAIAGDYMATLRASAGSESASAEYRFSVTTSTIWGIVGVLVIAVALLLSVGAVARYGRR